MYGVPLRGGYLRTDIQVIRQQSSSLFLVASYIFALCLFHFQCQHLSQCKGNGGLCIKEVSFLLARIPLNRVCVLGDL